MQFKSINFQRAIPTSRGTSKTFTELIVEAPLCPYFLDILSSFLCRSSFNVGSHLKMEVRLYDVRVLQLWLARVDVLRIPQTGDEV